MFYRAKDEGTFEEVRGSAQVIELNSRLVIENFKRKKNGWLTPSMNLSPMTDPDYWKVCPNFWYIEIQFNQSQAWTCSYLRAVPLSLVQ